MLRELTEYYDCLNARAACGSDDVVPDGYSRVPNVACKIVLAKDGALKEILPNTHSVPAGNKSKDVGWDEVFPFRYSVPGISAETVECRGKYLFGMEWDKDAEGYVAVKNSLSAYRKNKQLNEEFLSGISSPVAEAYRNFLKRWDPEKELSNSVLLSVGKEFNSAKFIIVVEGEEARDHALHCDREVKRKWEEKWSRRFEGQKDAVIGQCAVSGKTAPIARIHNNLTGITGGLATGVNLVCFKTSAFWSYGKQGSYNSSVSQEVMEKYTKAFNYLSSSKSHKRTLDDMTLLFWANTREREEIYLDEFIQALFESESNAETVAEGLTEGRAENWRAAIDEDTRFCVLGIKPNSSRLAVKIFERDSFGKIMENAERHQRDMRLSEGDKQLSVWAILETLKSPHVKDPAPPDLSAKLLTAVLQGGRYPDYLLQTVVRRAKTDGDDKQKKFFGVNRSRMRIVKACLVRSKYYKGDEFMLESKTHDQAYQCGRLFAVLEKIQTDALGDINATIKDKFFSSACNTPNLVFPRLLKLAQPHLEKLDKGANIFYDKLLQEILGETEGFPKALSLPRQGDFLLGYYQQKQKLYEKKAQ